MQIVYCRLGLGIRRVMPTLMLSLAISSGEIKANKFKEGHTEDSPASASTVLAGYEDIDRLFTDVVTHECSDKQIPAISFAIVDGGQIVIAKGVGYANADRTKAATSDSIYRVGSV